MKQGGLGLYDTFVHYDVRGKVKMDILENINNEKKQTLDG